MTAEKFKICGWCLETVPDDGGRISALSFKGFDLLNRAPAVFRRPSRDYGLYEERPVYGYDDCFPSVDGCRFPVAPGFDVPDHGELCWGKWTVERNGDTLDFKTSSRKLPVKFRRKLEFSDEALVWNFEVANSGPAAIPFLHVMHPLMPLGSVRDFEMPEFSSVFDEVGQKILPLSCPEEVRRHLAKQGPGSFSMLILRGVKAGKMALDFKFPIRLGIVFPESLFTSIGIWWNNSGYPAGEGLERCECAFEPIPGICSSLERCYSEGGCLSVGPNAVLSWKITWNIGSQE